jgi:predicted site-specific integrase-resolvase
MADQKLPLSSGPTQTATPPESGSTKRAAIYTRVSCGDQHPETQLYDLRELAKQRRFEVVREYSDIVSGAKSKRPGRTNF